MDRKLRKAQVDAFKRADNALAVFREAAKELEEAAKSHEAIALSSSRVVDEHKRLANVHTLAAQDAYAQVGKIREFIGSGK